MLVAPAADQPKRVDVPLKSSKIRTSDVWKVDTFPGQPQQAIGSHVGAPGWALHSALLKNIQNAPDRCTVSKENGCQQRDCPEGYASDGKAKRTGSRTMTCGHKVCPACDSKRKHCTRCSVPMAAAVATSIRTMSKLLTTRHLTPGELHQSQSYASVKIVTRVVKQAANAIALRLRGGEGSDESDGEVDPGELAAASVEATLTGPLRIEVQTIEDFAEGGRCGLC